MSKVDILIAKNMYDNGNSLSAISKYFNVSKSHISVLFKKNNIITRVPHIKTAITQKEIKRLISIGKTVSQIALQEKVSDTIIYKILNGNKRQLDVKYAQAANTKLTKNDIQILVNCGLTNIEIGKRLGFNRKTIGELIKEFGIVKPELISKEILQQYINDGLKNSQISNIVGCKLNKVKSLRKKYGINNRKLWENILITDDLKSVIIGIYLGDAHISKPIKNIKSHLEYGHSIMQGDIVRLVYKLLEPLMNNRNISVKAPDKPTEDTFYRIRTIHHPFFDELRLNYYVEKYFDNKEGLKRIDNTLLNWMNELSLALFYIDDGFFTDFNNKTKIGFCTDRFLKDDVLLLSNFINKKWNIKTYLDSPNNNLTTGYKLIIKEESIEKFERIISPYMVKCIRYKYTNQYFIPDWDDNSYYEQLINAAPKLPEPRIPIFQSNYINTRKIEVINNNEKISTNYDILQASLPEISNFLDKYHYKGRPVNSRLYMKLINNNELVGAAAFSLLRTDKQIEGIFNLKLTKYDGLDVSRFACLDKCGKNTESMFLSECIKAIIKLSPNTKFLITYSQPEYGHYGYIYQATNWIYVSSLAGAKIQYLLDNKPITRKTLKRYHGINTGRKEWRLIYNDRLKIIEPPPKHKYLFIIDKSLDKHLNIPYLPYPKIDNS